MPLILVILISLLYPIDGLGQQNSPIANKGSVTAESAPKTINNNQENQGNKGTPDLAVIKKKPDVTIDKIKSGREAVFRQEEREEKSLEIQELDLTQQKTMAEYTKRLFFVSASQILLSAIGLWIVWKTLRATAVAAKSAQDSARAAEKAVEQGRAWVVFDSRIDTKVKAPRQIIYEFTTIWRNAGKTPALDVQIEHRTESFKTNEIEDSVPTFEPSGEWDVIGILGPGVTHPGHIQFSTEQVNILLDKSRRCFIYTFIKYKTIYGQECVMETVEEIKATSRIVEVGIARTNEIGFFINSIGAQQRAT